MSRVRFIIKYNVFIFYSFMFFNFLNASNMFDGIDGQTGGYFLFILLYLYK